MESLINKDSPQAEKPENPSPSPESASPSDSESEHIPFDASVFEHMLQTECRLWQKKLRLQDWNVKVHLCRLHEMPDREAIGAIIPIPERKDAQMYLLSPMDTPLLAQHFIAAEEMNYALTIVHELLHLHLAPFTQHLSDAEQVQEEVAINAISRCLVNAYAKQHKPLTPPVTAPVGHYL